jgi:pimeloyl-ACP methyl ester carboxylesterase
VRKPSGDDELRSGPMVATVSESIMLLRSAQAYFQRVKSICEPSDGHMPNGLNHINLVVPGTDDPTLIFVHGFACSLGDWEEQFRGLSARFRCVALDLPGHGDSAKPETISIEIMGNAVNRVKDRIAARSTILVGHSMGCRVITDAFQQSGATVS